jgi:hypothetical protein
MAECMTFPATFDEFAEEYKITDTKEVYTNGGELIPIFRVKQWLEHLTNKKGARYIDANKIHQFVNMKVAEGKDGWAQGVPYEWACALTIIDNAPTADVVEVKHGEWVEKDCITESNRGRTIHYVTNKCSVCGKWNGRHKSNYCPNCGAKMDGGKAK